MGWKPKKKKKPLSYNEQQFVKNLIESTKAKRKTLRGYAILKRKGSTADYKMSGVFKDINELKEHANDFAKLLCKISGKTWEVVEVVENENIVYNDDESE